MSRFKLKNLLSPIPGQSSRPHSRDGNSAVNHPEPRRSVQPPGAELADGVKAIGETMTQEWLAEAGEAGAAILSLFRSDRPFAARR